MNPVTHTPKMREDYGISPEVVREYPSHSDYRTAAVHRLARLQAVLDRETYVEMHTAAVAELAEHRNDPCAVKRMDEPGCVAVGPGYFMFTGAVACRQALAAMSGDRRGCKV